VDLGPGERISAARLAFTYQRRIIVGTHIQLWDPALYTQENIQIDLSVLAEMPMQLEIAFEDQREMFMLEEGEQSITVFFEGVPVEEAPARVNINAFGPAVMVAWRVE